jgi:hypothetical protein
MIVPVKLSDAETMGVSVFRPVGCGRPLHTLKAATPGHYCLHFLNVVVAWFDFIIILIIIKLWSLISTYYHYHYHYYYYY